jgi:PhzF family phenazine biosynthesis protein
MKTIPIYQIDAFTDRLFRGNPAAVCPLDLWLPDEILQSIAAENNLAETAFFIREGSEYRLRWFTPTHEVDLCGHATLAAAFVIFRHLGHSGDRVAFESRSGPLAVARNGNRLELDFPDRSPEPCPAPEPLLKAFGLEGADCLRRDDYILVLEGEASVKKADPDLRRLRELDLRGVCITAPGDEADFVSRFFAPKYGIDEDPVTGSAHTQLAPYWAKRLGKNPLRARQASKRGGEIDCRVANGRVFLGGEAVLYLEGRIFVDF